MKYVVRGIWLLFVLSIAINIVQCAKADVITEIGAGVKIPASTSLVLLEKCHEVQVIETRPYDQSVHRVASCGGDNPTFIGWPVAWERDMGVWTVRAGWFHLSHWFDGGADREVHLDCACATVRINWREVGRRRNGKK